MGTQDEANIVQAICRLLDVSTPVDTIAALVRQQALLDACDAIMHDEEDVYVRNNKRPIDRRLFDPLNMVLPLKGLIYRFWMWCLEPVVQLPHDDQAIHDFVYDSDLGDLAKEHQTQTRHVVDSRLPILTRGIIAQVAKRYDELRGAWIAIKTVCGFRLLPSKQHVMRAQYSILRIILSGICQNKKLRQYLIWINTIDRDGIMVLHKLSPAAIAGVMTHEFGHQADYHSKSSTACLAFLLAFVSSPRFVRYMERITDETAVARGAGLEMYQFRTEIFAHSSAAYINYKKRTYLTPEQLLYAIIKHADRYSLDALAKTLDLIHQRAWESVV